MRPIKVGYDAQSLTGKHQTGLGVYAKNLARVLERHPETVNLKHLWPKHHRSFRRTLERLAWEQYHLVMAAHNEEVDILHVPCFSIPRFTRIPRVVTAHDLIVMKSPSLMPPGSRWYFSKWIPQSYKSADHIIAVSHATKNDLVNLLGIDPGKITVIYHGINPAYDRVTDPHEINRVRFKYHCPREFFVMIGSFEPRKNLKVAIEAFDKMSKDDEFLKLILVGKTNTYQTRMIDFVESLGLEDRVIFPGYIPDKDLAALLSVATAYLFPSSAEGFGLPLVEAMATGCPIIASDLPVFHEIGGDAVSYVPVSDHVALSDTMQKMHDNPGYRVDFVVNGMARSIRFSWDHAAEETVKVYLRVLTKRGINLGTDAV